MSTCACVICLQDKTQSAAMHDAHNSSTRRLVVRVMLISYLLSCLEILVVYIWTRTEQTCAKCWSRCVDFNEHLRQLKMPLLCIFTTFKPRTEKIPVSMSAWSRIFETSLDYLKIFLRLRPCEVFRKYILSQKVNKWLSYGRVAIIFS